jgi:hypothetical protein
MRAIRILATFALTTAGLLLTPRAWADSAIGRYQMIALPTKPGSFDSRIMILDTADGHLWQWWESPAVGSATPSNGIIYMGKVAPGGIETPPIHRGGPPEPLIGPNKHSNPKE